MDGRERNVSPEQYNEYANELFAKKDYAEAVKFYTKAAELGNAKAQFNLGLCYGKGCGVEKNVNEALKWLRMAAVQGEPDAVRVVGLLEQAAPAQKTELNREQESDRLLKMGNAYRNNKAFADAAECYRRAANLDNAEAMYFFGMCLGQGVGVEKNINEADAWLRKAAQSGNKDAKVIIAKLDEKRAELEAKAIAERKAKENARPKVIPEKAKFDRIKPFVDVITLGQVEHGKTTLTAAILKYLALQDKAKYTDYARIDKANSEKTLGVTVNTTRVEYETETRHYTHVDCPNHKDYIKNMLSGSTKIDGAILVVSAADGPMAQTREHILIARQICVPQILVFLNKCDQVADEELLALVETEIREILALYQFDDDINIIRGSAINVLQCMSDDPDAPEYECIKELLYEMDTTIPEPERKIDEPFLMPVEDVFTIAGRGVIATGKIERGAIHVNDKVEIVGFEDESRISIVAGVEMFSKKLDYGEAGDNVGILLYGIQPTAVRRGQVLAIPHTIKTHTVFSACIYLFTKSEGGREKPLFNSDRVRVYIRTTEVLGIVSLSEGMEMILPGDTSEAEITLITPMPIEENLRFTIRESGRVIGFGVVTTIIV